LQIDADARVLFDDGRGFANLFAGGGAARGVSGPSYWGYLPAMGLGSAITLGWIAGVNAAKVTQTPSPR
jgi:fumarate reductase flavoprotein subunit